MNRRIPVLVSIALLTGLVAALPGTQRMPWCKADQSAPTRPPADTPSLNSPDACRARVSSLQRTAPVPAPGYHHLGATTVGGWSGVLARLKVADADVRENTFDFLATRVMAKAETPNGMEWLEAGWSEIGWDGMERQQIYTYDTNTDAWAFYEQYRVAPGDRFWIYLQTEKDGAKPAWQAWLWWGDTWNLLTSQELPLTGRAKIEQYAEVHTDNPFNVPSVTMDNVSLKDGPAGPLVVWTNDIPTTPGRSTDKYCLTWTREYDSWTANTCLPL